MEINQDYTIDAAAKKLNVCKTTVLRWIKNGKLEAYMSQKDGFVGRPGYRISQDSVEQMCCKLTGVYDKNECDNEKCNDLDMINNINEEMREYKNAIAKDIVGKMRHALKGFYDKNECDDKSERDVEKCDDFDMIHNTIEEIRDYRNAITKGIECAWDELGRTKLYCIKFEKRLSYLEALLKHREQYEKHIP